MSGKSVTDEGKVKLVKRKKESEGDAALGWKQYFMCLGMMDKSLMV